MRTVCTKEELKEAVNSNEYKIEVVGSLASQLVKAKKVSKGSAIGGGLAILGGVIAAPFTGGLSLAGAVAGSVAISGGTVVVLVAITAITGITFYALKKNYDVTIVGSGVNVRIILTHK